MALNSSLKTVLQASGACIALTMSSQAFADNYGCEALLCFAGGKGVSECQPTIKRVLKDLAKGKSFPHCTMVNGSGQATSEIKDAISVRRFTETQKSPICKDGETKGRRIFGGIYSCPTIEINVSPAYAVDGQHQKQIFNYQL